MKRLLVLALMLLLVPAANASDEKEPLPRGGLTERILPIGDSITKGARGYQSYRGALIEMLQADDYHARYVGPYSDGPRPSWAWWSKQHAGHNGRRIGSMSARTPTWLNTYKPDVILLLAGSNDQRLGTPIMHAADHFDTLIDTARNHDAWIFIMAPLPRYQRPQDTGGKTYHLKLADELRARIQARADCHVIFVEAPNYRLHDTRDGVHPNAGGEIKIAHAWHQALTTASC